MSNTALMTTFIVRRQRNLQMISASELTRISELGRMAGSVPMAQVSECPYGHESSDERYAWLAGFSRGRADAAAPVDRISQGAKAIRRA